MKYRYLKLINGYPCSFISPQDKPIDHYRLLYGEDCYEFILPDNEHLKERYVIKDSGLVEATEFDRYIYDGEDYKLPENHYFKKNASGEIIDVLEKPEHDYIHPIWNDQYEVWLESATDWEIFAMDKSDINQIIMKQDRDIYAQIALDKYTKTIKSYDAEKETMAFKKSENTKYLLCGSDYLRGAVTFEEYQEAKMYMHLMLEGEAVVRPPIMYKYDGVI